MSKHNVLAVDLDGTLAKRQEPFDPYGVGAPVKPIMDYVKQELANGRKVVCFTARAASKDPKMHKAVRDWLDQHGLEKVKITNQKDPTMSEFIDDKAVGVVPDKGKIQTTHPTLKSARDIHQKLTRLSARRGECPECGGKPKDYSGKETQCQACSTTFTPGQEKTAALQSPTGQKDPERFDFSKVARSAGFHRPENHDRYDTVPKQDLEFWAGSNDWEDSITWLWCVHRRAGDPDITTPETVWAELQYPGYPDPGDEDKITRKQSQEMRQMAKKIQQLWRSTAEKIAMQELDLDAVEQALQHPDMVQYIKQHGRIKLQAVKKASGPARTGPRAIQEALARLDIKMLEQKAKEQIGSGRITHRDKGVKMLNVLTGLKRNELLPHELMITKVPVLPPAFRPFALMGGTYIAGNANELYADLFKHKAVHDETIQSLGESGAAMTRKNLLGAVRALYGYGDPVSPKLVQRGVQGYLHELTGDSPKTGFVNRKLIGKPIDSVGRSVITVNPDLDMKQISLPRDMAWNLYGSLVQGRLARQGVPASQAIKFVKDRSREAELALQQELKERPVIYSRAPAWHKFNTISGYAAMHDGDDIRLNPYVAAGLNADNDGDDCINQILACIPRAAASRLRMSYPNLRHHLIRFSAGSSSIPAMRGADLYLFDLEDFPHGALLRTKRGRNGRIDFHQVDEPVFVLAHDDKTNTLRWSQVSCWSRHYARKVEIVDTHNGYQIVTDDDPRAVYGTAAGALVMRRFTPHQALDAGALVPRARHIPDVACTVRNIPTARMTRSSKALPMLPTIPADANTGWVLGAMCGDGWVCKVDGIPTRFDFADNEGFNARKLQTLLETMWPSGGVPKAGVVVSSADKQDGRHGDTTSYRFASIDGAHWFHSLLGGERDKTTSGSGNKHLPAFYLSTPEEFRSGLLCGLLDTDGSVALSRSKSKPQLVANFTSTSIRLVQECKLLAASLGISSRITPSHTPLGKDCWQLNFCNHEFQQWGAPYLAHERKRQVLKYAAPIKDSRATARYDIVPVPERLAMELSAAVGCPKISSGERRTASAASLQERKTTQALYMTLAQARNRKHTKYGAMSRQGAEAIVARVGRNRVRSMTDGAQWLQILDNASVTWERVTGVQVTEIKEDGFDLTVPGFETFMAADGVILSNTINVSLPLMHASVQEAKEKLMPDKMLFGIKDLETTMAQPKHEMILGMASAAARPSTKSHRFASEQEAVAAVRRGDVKLSDEIELP